jgi:hypothetical protein
MLCLTTQHFKINRSIERKMMLKERRILTLDPTEVLVGGRRSS